KDRFRKICFWSLFASECTFGLISGMKGMLLLNFVSIGVIASLITGKTQAKWIMAALLGVIMSYPFFDAYRSALSDNGSRQILAGGGVLLAERAGWRKSVNDSTGLLDWVGSGGTATLSRLNLLTSVHELLDMADTSRLRGE